MIERKKKNTYAHDDVMEAEPAAEEVAEVSEEVEAPEGPETATLSLAILGGQQVSPGDIVRLEVVESDADSGTVTVKYKSPGDSGVAGAASKFASMDKTNQGAM